MLGQVVLACLAHVGRNLKTGPLQIVRHEPVQRVRGVRKLGREADDVEQRRAQVMAHDVGETLYLLVCQRQVRGAFEDGRFQPLLSCLQGVIGDNQLLAAAAQRTHRARKAAADETGQQKEHHEPHGVDHHE